MGFDSQTSGKKPRERLASGRGASVSDEELLSVLFGNDARGHEAFAKIHALLARFGGLAGLASKHEQTLARAGLSTVRIAKLRAAVEIGRRYLEAPARQAAPLTSPADAARCFHARLADLPYEVFACLFLDTRHRFICFETLFRGTIDGATVHTREVAKCALDHHAAAVIAGHNHPSGDCEPSEADRNITTRLKRSLELLDIKLLDHLVVTRSAHVSLAERGWL